MRLTNTYDSIFNTTVPGEDWEPVPGLRIVPENALDRNALAQVWALQRLDSWRLDGREIPWNLAGFSKTLEWQNEGFATANLLLTSDIFNPFESLKQVQDAPIVTVYWLWQNNEIIAYWSVPAGTYNQAQTNQALFPIVFR